MNDRQARVTRPEAVGIGMLRFWPFDRLRVVSKALRGPQGREPVESVEPQAL